MISALGSLQEQGKLWALGFFVAPGLLLAGGLQDNGLAEGDCGDGAGRVG